MAKKKFTTRSKAHKSHKKPLSRRGFTSSGKSGMLKSMNTVSNGRYRWMIYKEADAWIGVALEFNIVVTGDDPRLVELDLQEAVLGYLESAKKLKKGFREPQINALLNQEAEEEYESKWNNATQVKTPKDFLSPLSSEIYKAGVSSLVPA